MTESQQSDETTPNASAESAERTEEAPQPAPSNGQPKPSTPSGPTPAAMAKRLVAPTAGTPSSHPVGTPPSHTTSLEEARRFARVEDDGHVFLLVQGEEHPVGQYPDASRDEALAYFARKYDDAASQIALLEQRVAAKAPSTDMRKTVSHLRETVAERHMVGDVTSLEQRLEQLDTDIGGLEKSEQQQHEAARSAELATRENIVAEAEALASKDPASVQWKTTSTRMNELFDAWKLAQKSGTRLGRSAEDSLWKRFRSARTTFDRHRRAYFSQLDSDNAQAKATKEKLITDAEALSTSTDWGRTAAEYRHLMDEWKASRRAGRKDDDALWTRFRAAQDKFFTARKAANEVIDEEFAKNLVVKDQLLKEAQSIDSTKNPVAARKALQSIRDRWEEAGKVPRGDMGRVEAGLRSVEDAVKAAEDEKWERTNPETQARTNSALSQLESAIASLEADLEKARVTGDAGQVRKAQEALDARQQWLDMLQKSARNFE
ncbi:DUF349 domain-containing protein [Arthrobacter roseus]|uniref:DUF349 domain-containing protein n=1 Tax=Arthrobacter roseus TaxID=136274 RepID=UPI003083FD36|nr:hypothetical protein [Arthrobacter roseus]